MSLQRTILYIEDDENDRFLVDHAVKGANLPLKLLQVPDGEEALHYFEGRGNYANRALFPLPDLVLLDLKLPRKSGHEVLRWIRGQKKLKNLPVVILTSSEQETDKIQALDSGANDYRVKPISLGQLKNILHEVFSKWIGKAIEGQRGPSQ